MNKLIILAITIVIANAVTRDTLQLAAESYCASLVTNNAVFADADTLVWELTPNDIQVSYETLTIGASKVFQTIQFNLVKLNTGEALEQLTWDTDHWTDSTSGAVLYAPGSTGDYLKFYQMD